MAGFHALDGDAAAVGEDHFAALALDQHPHGAARDQTFAGRVEHAVVAREEEMHRIARPTFERDRLVIDRHARDLGLL